MYKESSGNNINREACNLNAAKRNIPIKNRRSLRKSKNTYHDRDLFTMENKIADVLVRLERISGLAEERDSSKHVSKHNIYRQDRGIFTIWLEVWMDVLKQQEPESLHDSTVYSTVCVTFKIISCCWVFIYWILEIQTFD